MLRGVRGFDTVNGGGAPLLFNNANGDDTQRTMVAGRDGNGLALFMLSSGFGNIQLTEVYDPQQTWGVHFDYAVGVSGQAPAYKVVEFLRIGTVAGTVVSLRQRSDGKIDILNDSGAIIVTSSESVPAVADALAANYVGIELKVVAGPIGSVEMHFDGVQVAQANVALPGPPYPDRITIHDNGFGPPGCIFDNMVIWDGQQGDRFNTFTGRLRVITLPPIADTATNWAPSTGTECFPRVNSTTGPSGDASFISPVAGGGDQLFTITKPTCFAAIYALAINACARPTSGAPTLDFLFQGKTSTQVIGSVHPAFVGRWNTNELIAQKDYLYYQALAVNSPDSGDMWTDQEITNAEFGLGASATPTLRVCQFYLEKVASLVPQPFDCGGGPYTF